MDGVIPYSKGVHGSPENKATPLVPDMRVDGTKEDKSDEIAGDREGDTETAAEGLVGEISEEHDDDEGKNSTDRGKGVSLNAVKAEGHDDSRSIGSKRSPASEDGEGGEIVRPATVVKNSIEDFARSNNHAVFVKRGAGGLGG